MYSSATEPLPAPPQHAPQQDRPMVRTPPPLSGDPYPTFHQHAAQAPSYPPPHHPDHPYPDTRSSYPAAAPTFPHPQQAPAPPSPSRQPSYPPVQAPSVPSTASPSLAPPQMQSPSAPSPTLAQPPPPAERPPPAVAAAPRVIELVFPKSIKPPPDQVQSADTGSLSSSSSGKAMHIERAEEQGSAKSLFDQWKIKEQERLERQQRMTGKPIKPKDWVEKPPEPEPEKKTTGIVRASMAPTPITLAIASASASATAPTSAAPLAISTAPVKKWAPVVTTKDTKQAPTPNTSARWPPSQDADTDLDKPDKTTPEAVGRAAGPAGGKPPAQPAAPPPAPPAASAVSKFDMSRAIPVASLAGAKTAAPEATRAPAADAVPPASKPQADAALRTKSPGPPGTGGEGGQSSIDKKLAELKAKKLSGPQSVTGVPPSPTADKDKDKAAAVAAKPSPAPKPIGAGPLAAANLAKPLAQQPAAAQASQHKSPPLNTMKNTIIAVKPAELRGPAPPKSASTAAATPDKKKGESAVRIQAVMRRFLALKQALVCIEELEAKPPVAPPPAAASKTKSPAPNTNPAAAMASTKPSSTTATAAAAGGSSSTAAKTAGAAPAAAAEPAPAKRPALGLPKIGLPAVPAAATKPAPAPAAAAAAGKPPTGAASVPKAVGGTSTDKSAPAAGKAASPAPKTVQPIPGKAPGSPPPARKSTPPPPAKKDTKEIKDTNPLFEGLSSTEIMELKEAAATMLQAVVRMRQLRQKYRYARKTAKSNSRKDSTKPSPKPATTPKASTKPPGTSSSSATLPKAASASSTVTTASTKTAASTSKPAPSVSPVPSTTNPTTSTKSPTPSTTPAPKPASPVPITKTPTVSSMKDAAPAAPPLAPAPAPAAAPSTDLGVLDPKWSERLTKMQQGQTLAYYTVNKDKYNKDYIELRLSSDKQYIKWSKGMKTQKVKVSDITGLTHGPVSETFKLLRAKQQPLPASWFCFSFTAEKKLYDFGAGDDENLVLWYMGVQALILSNQGPAAARSVSLLTEAQLRALKTSPSS